MGDRRRLAGLFVVWNWVGECRRDVGDLFGKVSYSCILLTCWAASALSVLFMWFRSGNVNTLR
jgi:hypothetical protein